MKFNNLIIVLFLSLLGCQPESQEEQQQVRERFFPGLHKIQIDGKSVSFYICYDPFIMLDYDFYVTVATTPTDCAILFAEYPAWSEYSAVDDIVLEVSDSPDSIFINFKSNLLKLRSYIQQSTYFNQEHKLQNKINTLQYIVQKIIYCSEQPKKCIGNYITYADCKRMGKIKLSNTEITSDTINWTFCSEITKRSYPLSLIIDNECIKDLLVK